MSAGPGLWGWVASTAHVAGACAAITVAVSIWGQRERYSGAGKAVVASLAMTALWCLAVVVEGELSLVAQGLLGLRNLSYLWAIYAMFASDGRHTSLTEVGPVVAVLCLVDILVPAVQFVEHRINPALLGEVELYQLNIMLAMLGVVGSLVLVHNLYASASSTGRQMLRWPALALAAVWVFELNLYTVAYLAKHWPVELASLHGLLDIGFAGIMALGAAKGREALRLKPSRTVTFQSISLIVIGLYFVGMIAIARWLASAGGELGRWWQFSFLIAAISAAALLLPSRRMRGWMRVMFTKHFFQHRYDYREEWLRFARTIGGQGRDAAPLHQRAVQAMADITDSPAGLLLTPDETGEMVLAARWQWPTAEVPAQALGLAAAHFLAASDHIIDLDTVRSDGDSGIAIPEWLREESRAWAVVPLQHNGRLLGAVILARPPHDRKLDWEDFDLLRVVAQQIGTYLAEHQGQQALAEAARFDEFHRRIAFVMHDIKNLSSQLSLLARNAERHAENPDFRADMLVTLRNSADKLNHLVARLSRYGTSAGDKAEPVEVGALARQLAETFRVRHNVQVIERDTCTIAGQSHSIEQVLTHLIQNAVDASEPEMPVFVSISGDGLYGRIEIVDSGHGMAPEFVRNRLFKPFDSSKPGGFGIGAYEARELVRAMHGRLEVESREGIGTRFIVRLPLASAAEILKTMDNEQKVA